MTYASNNNAVLIDGCNNLQNLKVSLGVIENVATTDGSGWSLQLNCYPPPGEYCQTSQVNIVQYIVYVQGGSLAYEIQYWAGGASTWPPGYTPQPGTTPWLPCWANDYYLSSPFASINGDTLPRNSQLDIALVTNRSGGVTQVNFTYTDPNGKEHPAQFNPPAVLPIVACTLNFVGPGGGANANFTQGLASSRGSIYYSVSSGQLSVQNGGAGAACGESGYGTAETSNMTYSDIYGAPAALVTQVLQQPVTCTINNLFEGERVRLGEMERIRDVHVAQHAAGQWLIEVLDRHAADLAVLVASDDGELARIARDLLTQAVHTAQQGRVFEGNTIDHALKVLREVSWKLPPSMHHVGQAGAALLESLRGRTLEDGLKAASTTIRPRPQAPRRLYKK
jgi:hypothetical protein